MERGKFKIPRRKKQELGGAAEGKAMYIALRGSAERGRERIALF